MKAERVSELTELAKSKFFGRKDMIDFNISNWIFNTKKLHFSLNSVH